MDVLPPCRARAPFLRINAGEFPFLLLPSFTDTLDLIPRPVVAVFEQLFFIPFQPN